MRWIRTLETNFIYKPNGIKCKVRTKKFRYEPNFIFEKRHNIMVKLKKMWVRIKYKDGRL